MTTTYEMNVGPDYTVAHYYAGNDAICLTEWTGRSADEFNAGMRRKGGYSYRQETVDLGGRIVTSHTWTK